MNAENGLEDIARGASVGQDVFFESYGFRILKALRRIIRAVDVHSHKLQRDFKVTAPQLICLYSLVQEEPMMLSTLAKRVSLGASTVNGIVDRLEVRGLVKRQRSDNDRRAVNIQVTDAGIELVRKAPSLLQDRLSAALRRLPELEQATIALSLERIVDLMEAGDLSTSPNLMPGAKLNENTGEEQ